MLEGDIKWARFIRRSFILPSHTRELWDRCGGGSGLREFRSDFHKVNTWREIEQDRAGLIDDDDLAGTIRLVERWHDLGAEDRIAMRQAAAECFARRFEITNTAADVSRVFEQLIERKMKRASPVTRP